ncbi:hypothetical protein BFL35_10695 [Clavibacter michiganensis]|nr:hypothetical protein BFL35_10695 [Clavibacter michiganensis]
MTGAHAANRVRRESTYSSRLVTGSAADTCTGPVIAQPRLMAIAPKFPTAAPMAIDAQPPSPSRAMAWGSIKNGSTAVVAALSVNEATMNGTFACVAPCGFTESVGMVRRRPSASARDAA